MKKLEKILQFNITYLVLIIFLIGYIYISTIIIKRDSKIAPSTLIGTVVDVDIDEEKISFITKNNEKVKCVYYLNKKDNIDYKNLLGKKVKIKGNKKEIINNTIPNTFNYKKYLYNNKIYLSIIVDKIEIIKEENMFYRLKNNIINRINNQNETVKTYLSLLILGDKGYLSDDVYNQYQTNGIWHLFAISGMHISLIILILDLILKKIRFKKIIICIFLLYFLFLTGYSASVLRTTFFYFLKSFFVYKNIQLRNDQILILTAAIILLFSPLTIYNIGFQYSFLISYAVMLESKRLTGKYFVKIFKTSFLSFIVSLPITINLNYEINLLSIFLNVIYVPFVTFIIFPLSIISFLIPMFSNILLFFINLLEYSNKLFYNFKFLIVLPRILTIIFVSYYIILYIYYKTRKPIFLISLFFLFFVNLILPKLSKEYQVSFLDIGQGDSSLIITPYQKEVLLIDTGGLLSSTFSVSDNIIKYLKSIGINKLNSVIITHGDYDHMGEAINLINNFKVEKVIFNCGEFNKLEQELIQVLDKKKILYYSCIKELNVDDNKLYFLNIKIYDNENDNSSVIYTELDNHKFLFMGDAGIEVEEDLIEKYNLHDIDVLKVGHHGSKTSSSKSFIEEIEPKYSVISVGKNNRYGHPNKEVLDNLKESKIYRTDQDGSVMFKIKKNKLETETCTP